MHFTHYTHLRVFADKYDVYTRNIKLLLFLLCAIIHAWKRRPKWRVLLNRYSLDSNLCNIRWNDTNRPIDIKLKIESMGIGNSQIDMAYWLYYFLYDKPHNDSTIFTWLTKKWWSQNNSFRVTRTHRSALVLFPFDRFSSVPARTRFHIRRSTLRVVTCLLKLDICVCGTDSYAHAYTCTRIERAGACAR